MKAHRRESLNQPAPIKNLPAQPADVGDLLKPLDYILLEKHLYMLANDIWREAPWKCIFEDELFGVQVPGTDRVWFVSVTGSEGELPGLSFYNGYDALADLLDFRFQTEMILKKGFNVETLSRISIMPGGLNCIHHIRLSFRDRGLLREEDLAAIRETGLDFGESEDWPQFADNIPGYVPVYPDRETFVEIFLVMQQVLAVWEKTQVQHQYIQRDDDPNDTFLVRVPAGKGPEFSWTDQYLLYDPTWGVDGHIPLAPDENRLALSGLPEANQELLVDLIMIPVIPGGLEEETESYPFFLLMVDKHSGHVVCQVMLTPEPDLGTMYESVPQRIFEELIKIGHRPSKILIRTDLLNTLLSFTLDDTGCSLEIECEMPEMDRAVDLLFDSYEG